MKSSKTLPQGYGEIYSVNLQTDKKKALILNIAALLVAVVIFVLFNFIVPITCLFDMEKGLLVYFLRFAAIMVLTILYIVLHEAVHGITMKIFGTKKVKFGFTGLYAFAGSDEYYPKTSYIIIALAPVVFFGILLAAITPFLSPEWFWIFGIIQIMNLSGAAGDVFVTFKFLKMPKDILISDSGVQMTVYSKI